MSPSLKHLQNLFAEVTVLIDCDFGDDGTENTCGFNKINSDAVLPGNTIEDTPIRWRNYYDWKGHLYLYGDYGDDDVLIG